MVHSFVPTKERTKKNSQPIEKSKRFFYDAGL